MKTRGFIILSVFILISLLFVNGCQNTSLLKEKATLQSQIDGFISENQEVMHYCTFQNNITDLTLKCPTEGGFGSASGSYYEEYNKTGVNICGRIGGYESSEYNCTFIKYPSLNISKSKDLLIINNEYSYNFPECGQSVGDITDLPNYTVITRDEAKKYDILVSEKRCDKFAIQEIRNTCFLCLIQVQGKNANGKTCDELVIFDGEEYIKDNCIKSVAVMKNNSSYCEKINDSGIKESCLTQIAYSTKNIGLCLELNNTEKEGCLHDYWATLTGFADIDKTLCSKPDSMMNNQECEDLYDQIQNLLK